MLNLVLILHLTSVASQIDKDFKSTEREIQAFQTEKQMKLNELDVSIVLNFDQLRCMVAPTGDGDEEKKGVDEDDDDYVEKVGGYDRGLSNLRLCGFYALPPPLFHRRPSSHRRSRIVWCSHETRWRSSTVVSALSKRIVPLRRSIFAICTTRKEGWKGRARRRRRKLRSTRWVFWRRVLDGSGDTSYILTLEVTRAIFLLLHYRPVARICRC